MERTKEKNINGYHPDFVKWSPLKFTNFSLLYFQLRKAGSSSMNRGYAFPGRWGDARNGGYFPGPIPSLDPNEFIFTFTRNPWSRLVSLYFDKTKNWKRNNSINRFLMRNKQTSACKAHNLIKEKGTPFYAQYHKSTFDEFVFDICSQDIYSIDCNEHHRSYSHSIDLCEEKYSKNINFIGKLETLNDDLAHIRERFNLPQQPVPHKNKTKSSHYSCYYNSDTIKAVSEAYKEDIERFEYKFEKQN